MRHPGVGPAAPLVCVATVVEQIAAAVSMADAEDLPRLAELHTGFQKLAGEAEVVPDVALASRLLQSSRAGERLVEQIILRDVTDADAAIRALTGSVLELQQLVRVATGEAPPLQAPSAEPAAAAAAPTAHGHAPAAHAAVAETTLSPDDSPLALEFISEAAGHLEAAEANLLKLEEADRDPETVNAIFRSFHTIKGVAGFLNLKQIGALSHAAENLLDLARKGQLELAGVAVDLVLESVDLLKRLLAGLEAAVNTNGPIELRPELPSLLTRLHAAAAAAGGGEAPAPASQPAHVSPAPPSPASTPPAENAVAPAAAAAPAPAAQPAAAEQRTGASAGDAAAASRGDASVKVSTERLDSLINLVGELVVAQSMANQDVTSLAGGNHRVLRNMVHLGKITRELQDLSMSMRMVPIQGAFQKISRVVRDLCRKAGKEIELVIEGGETELDRNVVEAIGDPLVHMVRNAADHGIEAPDARAKAGKPRAGRLTLRAYHQAGTIVIEIADDGRGLNRKRIVEKAIAAGIVRPGQELSEQEIFRLIFHAGLSTAEKVTDISGRGVGMDVVRKNVEALRGRIDIQSAEGAGTTFSIRLPLTLAVIDGLIVRVGRERYIVPITSVEQSIRPKAGQVTTVLGRGEMCKVRDRLVPLLRLYRMFGVAPRTELPEEALVVVVHDDRRRGCLLVDELVGQQQVVIKSLGDGLGHVPGVSGGAILGDGNVSLILDVPELINLARDEDGGAAAAAGHAAPAPAAGR